MTRANANPTLEKPRLTLGYIALTDAAPLVAAMELGCFAAQGVEVTLSREQSWASIRDKTAMGVLDGAQMLAPMPLAMTVGTTGLQCPMVVPMSLDLNGNAITVSNDLHAQLQRLAPETLTNRPVTASGLHPIIAARRAAHAPPLKFGIVFPSSTHHYELRFWLAAAGIDPDNDVCLTVIPPSQMVRSLAMKEIDGYCVGEPWNTLAVQRRLGHVLITKYELWQNSPEKVLAFTQEWSERYPETLLAVTRALLIATAWLDESQNRATVADWLAQPRYLDAPVEAIRPSLLGRFLYSPDQPEALIPDFHVFHRYAATFPWVSHARWFLGQMQRWDHLPKGIDHDQLSRAVYRPDLYRLAAHAQGVSVPGVDFKSEGEHSQNWTLTGGGQAIRMGADRFFNGTTYSNPA